MAKTCIPLLLLLLARAALPEPQATLPYKPFNTVQLLSVLVQEPLQSITASRAQPLVYPGRSSTPFHFSIISAAPVPAVPALSAAAPVANTISAAAPAVPVTAAHVRAGIVPDAPVFAGTVFAPSVPVTPVLAAAVSNAPVIGANVLAAPSLAFPVPAALTLAGFAPAVPVRSGTPAISRVPAEGFNLPPEVFPSKWPCIPPFKQIANRCLHVETAKSGSWQEMRDACSQHIGGNLLKLTSADHLYSIVHHLKVERTLPANFWIGASNFGDGAQFRFTDGTPVKMGTPFWSISFVNGEYVQGPKVENEQQCVFLSSERFYYLEAGACTERFHAICEAPFVV